jgi:hypothetical protein
MLPVENYALQPYNIVTSTIVVASVSERPVEPTLSKNLASIQKTASNQKSNTL